MFARKIEHQIVLDIPFRGERNYVHPVDLFPALDDVAGEFLLPAAHVKNLTIRRRASRQVEAHFTFHTNAFGTFVLLSPHGNLQGWLVEGRPPITRRVAFDESAISRNAVVEQDRVFLLKPVNGYSGIEQMIVLFKMLCAQSHLTGWRFTAIDLDQPMRNDANLCISHKQTVLSRLFDADLHQDGDKIGRVQMALGPTQ